MKDHYETLGIDISASREAVRKAFRALTKKFHPDQNLQRSAWATAKMRDLIEAHRALSNPAIREVYDRQHRMHIGRKISDEQARRYRQHATRVTRAEMILDKLLSGKAAEAVETYEAITGREEGFDLKKHLTSRDWVDCKFLLAEEYERQGRHEKALVLFEKLYGAKESEGRYKHFMHELREKLLHLYTRCLAPAAAPGKAVEYYLRALGLEPGKSKGAFLHKKMAECHLALENLDEARRQLAIAFKLNPDLKGAAKICQRLGVEA